MYVPITMNIADFSSVVSNMYEIMAKDFTGCLHKVDKNHYYVSPPFIASYLVVSSPLKTEIKLGLISVFSGLLTFGAISVCNCSETIH